MTTATIETATIHPLRSASAVASNGAAPWAPHPTAAHPTAAHPAAVRLTRRGRFVLFLAAVGLVLSALVAFGPRVGASLDAGTPVQTTSVLVQPGQTLWDIAAKADPGGDIRSTVRRIVELNALPRSGALQPGQEIAVPTR